MNEYVIVNGELYHHGVKGMKWGVRRARANSSVSTGRRRSGKSTTTNDTTSVDIERKRKVKKGVKIGGAVAAATLAVIGGVALSKAMGKSGAGKEAAKLMMLTDGALPAPAVAGLLKA